MDVTQDAPQTPASVTGYGILPTFVGSASLGPEILPTTINGSIGYGDPTTPGIVKDERNGVDAAGRAHKLKQKRNKPTLSCLECVERKASRLQPWPRESR